MSPGVRALRALFALYDFKKIATPLPSGLLLTRENAPRGWRGQVRIVGQLQGEGFLDVEAFWACGQLGQTRVNVQNLDPRNESRPDEWGVALDLAAAGLLLCLYREASGDPGAHLDYIEHHQAWQLRSGKGRPVGMPRDLEADAVTDGLQVLVVEACRSST